MADPAIVRTRLDALVEALEAHLDATELRTGEADPVVFAAYAHLADAFVAYEEALYDAFDEVVPMSVVEYEDEEDDDEDDEDDEDLEDEQVRPDDLGDDLEDEDDDLEDLNL
jgi:hypothetical protein